MDLHWTDHVLFLIIGIVLPLQTVMGTSSQLKNLRFNTSMKVRLYWANNLSMWIMTAFVLGVWWYNDRSMAQIGLTAPLKVEGLSLSVMAVFMVLYIVDTINEIRNKHKRKDAAKEMGTSMSFLPKTAYEYIHYIGLALTAGFCEEIIFRGYFIRYFQCLLDGESTVAILLAAIIFGVVHLYQGWQSVVKIAAMAVMFGYVFIHTDSLWWLILIHVLVDLIGGAIAWALFATSGKMNGNSDK